MKLESQTIFGFDRRHKKHQFIGLDTTGTYYVTAAGPTDPTTGSIIAYGEDQDPVLGHTQKYNMVARVLGPDKYASK